MNDHFAFTSGVASIVKMYAAILLGFLVEGNTKARLQAAPLLPGATLQPVTAAIEQGLHFYVGSGAITPEHARTLNELLQRLKTTPVAGS
jgi:hypothetical protein